MARLETSPFKEETSSSPVTDGAGEASVLVHVVVVLWVDEESELELEHSDDDDDDCFWRLQYIILAVKINIIFWFTCKTNIVSP